MTDFKIERPVSTVKPEGRKFSWSMHASSWTMRYTRTVMFDTEQEADADADFYLNTLDKALAMIEAGEIKKQNIVGGLVSRGEFMGAPAILDMFNQ